MPGLFAILMSALWSALAWVFQQALIKFVIMTAIYLVVTALVPLIAQQLLPSGDGGLGNALSGMPAGVWYFLDLFQVTTGLPIMLSGLVTRFIVRRIPFFN